MVTVPRDLLETLMDMLGYVPAYFVEKCEYDKAVTVARELLEASER